MKSVTVSKRGMFCQLRFTLLMSQCAVVDADLVARIVPAAADLDRNMAAVITGG